MKLPRGLDTNIPYKALSVLIALALWFIVRDQRVEDTVAFDLDVEPPKGLVVGEAALPELTVRCLGTRSTLERLRRTARTHVVKLEERETGTVVVRIMPEDLPMPPGVEAFDVMPRTVTVRLEERVVRRLPVRARLVVANGQHAKRVTVTPDRVRIGGPASVVDSLQEVWTEAIEVSANGTQTAAVSLTHPKLQIDDPPWVKVEVELEPAPASTPDDGL